MPNWCSNRLYVKGKPEKVKEFTDTLGEEDANNVRSDFSFHQTVPMPEECSRGMLPAGYSGPNWYDWSIENWGTKWDACEVDCEADGIQSHVQNAIDRDLEETVIDIGFDTAWSPPFEWMEKASEKFPELDFEIAFSECGMDFYGTAEAKNGKIEDHSKRGCTLSENEDEFYVPSGEYGDFLEDHSLGTGG